MSRLLRTVLIIALTLAAAATSARAASLRSDLVTLWTTVLQTPSARNPFGTGGQTYACIDLGDATVAPFAPGGVMSCTVAPGTSIFIAANSVECSTFVGDQTPPTAPGDLRTCARKMDVAIAPAVTFDARPVTVTEVETLQTMTIVLPADNLFGLPEGTHGLSYGHGWVTLVGPLFSGNHTITITIGSTVINTSIMVK
jgi:hypothetical protein